MRPWPVHFIGLSIGGCWDRPRVEHGGKLASRWCDTLPSTPAGAPEVWQQRRRCAGRAPLSPLADPTTSAGSPMQCGRAGQGRWKQIRDTIIGTTPAGYLGCVAAIRNFDFVARLPGCGCRCVVCGADDAGTPPEGNRQSPPWFRRAL
jgi:3-oxoadipate enol-lactonase